MLCFKMTFVVLSMLTSQSSASFFDKFTGALSTVKSSVGKLLTDVGHELKETYDCTVDAVEEVFFDEDQISHYYDKCKKITTTEQTIVLPGQHINIYIGPIPTTTPEDETPKEVTTKKLEIPIVKIIRDDKDIDKKLEKVEVVLNNEYARVDNMSTNLEHEFVELAQNVDKELKSIKEDKIELEQTLLEIEKLHLQEEINIEKTKDQIRSAFEEILKKLNYNSKTEADLKNEFKDIVAKAEKNSSIAVIEELEKWKDKEMEELNEIKKIEEEMIQSSTDRIPRTFKDVAAMVSRTASTVPVSTTTSTTSTTSTPTPTTEVKLTITNTPTTTIGTTVPTTTTTTTTTEPTTTTSSTTKHTTTTTSTSTTESTTTTTTEPTTTTTSTTKHTTSTTTTPEPTTTTESTTTTTTEPTTTTIFTTTLNHKHHNGKKKHHTLSTVKPNDEFSDLEPTDTKAAAADALALFNKSKKTKSILDNFFRNLKAASGVLNVI